MSVIPSNYAGAREAATKYHDGTRVASALPATPAAEAVGWLAKNSKVVARLAKDTELIQFATEIKVRAERKCGELLAATEKNDGGRPAKNQSNATTSFQPAPTLADMGITKDQSSRYQSLASMTEAHFETAVATAKDTAGEVTTAFMLREAKRAKPTAKPKTGWDRP